MKTLLSLILSVVSLFTFGQNNKYQFYLDLNKINNDLLQITLETPEIKTNKIVYNIPKIVPGTYQIYDFGQYVMDFEAFDKEGNPLSVNQLDKNRWEIDNAERLSKISYWVEDTWDADVDDLVFEPGGTNMEEGQKRGIKQPWFFWLFRWNEKL